MSVFIRPTGISQLPRVGVSRTAAAVDASSLSRWISDSFELGSPDALKAAPFSTQGLTHLQCTPDSGLRGDIFVGTNEVYYETRGANGADEWFAMGALPATVPGGQPEPAVDPQSPAAIDAVSNWVNDCFELDAPDELAAAPFNADGLPHFAASASSGLNGEVYLGANEVYYRVTSPAGQDTWWTLGGLPQSVAAAFAAH